MRNLSKFALAAAAAAALAGAAAAAGRASHVMTVALPDGSVARIDYVGDVRPKVTIAPAAVAPGFAVPAGVQAVPMDGMFEQMDREIAGAMRQIDAMARQPLVTGPAQASVASFGNVPASSSSYSVVTVNENGHQCSRSTQVIGEGAGKPAKVISKVSGDCAAAPSAAPAIPVPRGPVHQS